MPTDSICVIIVTLIVHKRDLCATTLGVCAPINVIPVPPWGMGGGT